MSQKVVIENPCRLSYPHLFQPKEGMNGGAPKYGATILIPKSDAQTLNAINAAIQAEYAEASKPNGAWKGAVPPQPTLTLYDGDTAQPSGEPWGDECKGHMVLRTTSSNAPDVVDGQGNKAMDATKFYAGCYCYFSVNFAAYSNSGNKGIGAFLNCVMFAKDGEPLEARASAKSDFASIIAARANQIPGPAAPAAPAAAAPSFDGFAMPSAAPAPAAPVQPQAQMPTGFGGFGGFGGYSIPGQQ